MGLFGNSAQENALREQLSAAQAEISNLKHQVNQLEAERVAAEDRCNAATATSKSWEGLLQNFERFGHSLTELIGGQLDAGFIIDRFMEDWQPQPRFLIDRYLPTFLATRARRIG